MSLNQVGLALAQLGQSSRFLEYIYSLALYLIWLHPLVKASV